MNKITQILENVVRCKYFEVGVHIKNPIENSYQDGLNRTTRTLDHVVVVHILIWEKRESQTNEYRVLNISFGIALKHGQVAIGNVNICRLFDILVSYSMTWRWSLTNKVGVILGSHYSVHSYSLRGGMSCPRGSPSPQSEHVFLGF